MGLAFTKLFAKLFSKKEMRILMASSPSDPAVFMRLFKQAELLVINRSLASQAVLASSVSLQFSISIPHKATQLALPSIAAVMARAVDH